MTGNAPAGATIPIYYETDRKVLEAALKTVGLVEAENAKMLRIHNTLELGEVLISEAYRPQIEQREDLEIVAPATDLEFDGSDNLLPWK